MGPSDRTFDGAFDRIFMEDGAFDGAFDGTIDGAFDRTFMEDGTFDGAFDETIGKNVDGWTISRSVYSIIHSLHITIILLHYFTECSDLCGRCSAAKQLGGT